MKIKPSQNSEINLSFTGIGKQCFSPECFTSQMSDHVLLILLNKLGISAKMQGLPSILSLFCNKFKKFNNTGARIT